MQPIPHYTQDQWDALSDPERQEIIHWRLTVAREAEAERWREQLSSISFYRDRAEISEAHGENYWQEMAKSYSPGWVFLP